MKKSHALWGVLLIFVGLVWILSTTNTVSIDLWGSIRTLYPILIIAAGITLFMKKDAHWIRVIVWVLVFAVIGGYGVYLGYNDSNAVIGSRTFDMVDGMSRSKLEVSTMSASIRIGSTESSLAKVDTNIEDLNCSFSGGKSSTLRYYQKVKFLGSQRGRDFTADLNSTIPWDLELNTGATDGVLNLSNVIVGNCNINTAACDMDITVGNRQDKANIQLNCASANVGLTIPKGSGIRIETSTVSSNVRGNGIELARNNNVYESPNYDSAEKVIVLRVNSVSTEINVNVE